MKKSILSIIALAAVSCSVVEINPEQTRPAEGLREVVFNASSEATKTTISEASGSTRSISWTAGDQASIIWGTSDADKAVATAGSTGASTELTASVADAADYYAVYPASIEATMPEAGKLTIALPDNVSGEFANASVMVGHTTSSAMNFAFKNLTSLISFTIDSDDIVSVEVRGIGGETISGTATYSIAADGTPTLESIADTKTSVTVSTSGKGTYYIPVLPCTLTKGIIFRMRTEGAYLPGVGSTAALTASRSQIVNINGKLDSRVTANYFVKADGADNGNGRTWETAMNAKGLCALLETDADANVNLAKSWKMNNVKIHVAAGEYEIKGSSINPLVIDYVQGNNQTHITVLGGYPTGLTGTAVDDRNELANETIFTGKKQHSMFTFHDMVDFSFKGCTLKDAYLPETAQTSAVNGRGAVYIAPSTAADIAEKTNNGTKTMVRFENCVLKDNEVVGSTVGQAGAFDGGAAIHIVRGQAFASKCTFTGNKARYQGAAIRMNAGLGVLFLNSCLFTGNSLTNNWGTAIAVTDGHMAMNNCTVSGNSAATSNDSSVNVGGGSFLIVNSTIVENSTAAPLRLENCGAAKKSTIMSNLIMNSKDANAIILNAKTAYLVSKGHNYVGKAGGTGNANFTRDTAHGDLYAQNFSTLGAGAGFDAATGLYNWTCPSDFGKASQSEMESVICNDYTPASYPGLGNKFWAWINAEGRGGITVDYAGNSRPESAMCPGSSEN